VLRDLFKNDINRLGLDTYLNFDLNADMMREDLNEMGVKIRAKHFDLEKA
jgi:hypothetical protein